jgi:subtilisin family serine protease
MSSKRQYGIDSYNVLKTYKNISKINNRNWTLNYSGIDSLPYTGKGQKIAIMDTGVVRHDEFRNNITIRNFIDDKDDECGHGTFVAGEIFASHHLKGVAPESEGFCYKVLYGDARDGNVDKFDFVLSEAIVEAVDNGCGVISMSLGSSIPLQATEEALQYAVEHGVIPCASSGNEGMYGYNFSYPASYVNCISVSSANKMGLPSWFATIGVGANILEQPEISVASLEYYLGCVPNGYGYMQGTSMACPIIAGVALLWREAMKDNLPEKKNILGEFRKWLRKVAQDTNCNGWDNALGYGVLKIKMGDL